MARCFHSQRCTRVICQSAAIVLMATAWCSGTVARAETVNDAYQGALKAYYAGDYSAAVAGFKRVLAVPMEHPDLHYNLGCAYYRQGKLGLAIYHLEQALAFDRDAEDVRFNLVQARAAAALKVRDEVKGGAQEPLWIRALSTMAPWTWTVCLIGVWWIAIAALLVVRFLRDGPLRSGLLATAGVALVLALVCGGAFAAQAYQVTHVRYGIVLADRVVVREGPDGQAKESFRIHAGLKVRLLQVLSGSSQWARIRLANGLEGWVDRQELGEL